MKKTTAWLLASVKVGFLACFSLMGLGAFLPTVADAAIEELPPCHQQMEAAEAKKNEPEGACPMCIQSEDAWSEDFVLAPGLVIPETGVALLPPPMVAVVLENNKTFEWTANRDPDPHQLRCVRSVVLRI